MATESQRQQRHAAAASHLSADSGSSVFLLRVRISYPSSSTLPHHCDSTSPGLLGVDRSSTVSAGSDPCMSGVCGLSVLETHRISRATRTANVMSLFVFCESRGGRRTTLSPIIYLWSQPSASPVDLSVGRRPSALLAAELPLSRPPLSLHARGPPRRAADPRRPPQAKGTVRTRPLPSSSPAPSPPVTPTFASSLFLVLPIYIHSQSRT